MAGTYRGLGSLVPYTSAIKKQNDKMNNIGILSSSLTDRPDGYMLIWIERVELKGKKLNEICDKIYFI